MSHINLTNIKIRRLTDKNSDYYYLIIDENNHELNQPKQVFFCFPKSVKEGWGELESNWENLKEIELEYETNERGNNKVTGLWTSPSFT
jgi:hypothetical protein